MSDYKWVTIDNYEGSSMKQHAFIPAGMYRKYTHEPFIGNRSACNLALKAGNENEEVEEWIVLQPEEPHLNRCKNCDKSIKKHNY